MSDKNVLGEPATLHVDDLKPYWRNPRRGNVAVIRESIIKNGLYKPLVINKGDKTGRKLECLAGNHTLAALRDLVPDHPELEQVPVWLVDVDDDAAARIVLVDNRTSDKATYEDIELFDLLSDLDLDLEGTGYTPEDLDELDALLHPEEPEPEEETTGDDFTTIRFTVPPPIANQWAMFSNVYDSPEEAFEALLDGQGGGH